MNTHNISSKEESPRQAGNPLPAGNEGQIASQAEKAAAVPRKRRFNAKAIRTVAIVIAIIAVLAGLAFRFKGLLIAAMVNGRPVSRLAVIKELEKQGGEDVLSTLIDKQLIANEAKAKGITVSREEISQEMKKYEDQFNVNGNTLDDSLAAQNLTRADLEAQIAIQLEITKLLGDKADVSDAEVDSYIKDNGITVPEGQEDAAKSQVKSQLQQQKLSQEVGQLLNDLKAKADIKTFVNY